MDSQGFPPPLTFCLSGLRLATCCNWISNFVTLFAASWLLRTLRQQRAVLGSPKDSKDLQSIKAQCFTSFSYLIFCLPILFQRLCLPTPYCCPRWPQLLQLQPIFPFLSTIFFVSLLPISVASRLPLSLAFL